MKKFWKHDCPECVYLASEDVYDLYCCPNSMMPQMSSLVIRFGDEGHEYSSMMNSLVTPTMRTQLQEKLQPGDSMLSLILAQRLAVEKGIVTYPDDPVDDKDKAELFMFDRKDPVSKLLGLDKPLSKASKEKRMDYATDNIFKKAIASQQSKS